jgi:hypothetical protein
MRLIFILLLALTSGLHAQSNWQPGYIIKDGQKIEGEIDDREWPYFIESFRFRPSSGAEVAVYAPSDGVDFGVGNRRFEAKEVSYITNSRELDKISRDTLLERETSIAFLRQYYDGELSLYQFVDPLEKRHFYVQRGDQALEYLEYELRLREQTDKEIVRYLNNYKSQLASSLVDCPTVLAQVSDSDYNLKDLRKLVNSWYKCQQVEPKYVGKVSQGEISFGGLAAFLQTTPIGQDSETGEVSNEAHSGPALGVGARYVFPGAREKYALKMEALYHSFTDAARLQTRAESSSTSIIRREFSASVVQVHLLAEVFLLTGRTSVYVEGGVAASFLLDSDQSQSQITIAPDGTQSSINQDLNARVNMTNELGWLAGLGVRRGPFQVGVRASRVARLKGNSGIGFFRAGVLAGYWF